MKTRIPELRAARGWTQAVLAERAGVRQATISKVENKPLCVELETIQRVAQAFGVTIGELLADDDGDPTPSRLLALMAQLSPDDRRVIERSAQGILALRAQK